MSRPDKLKCRLCSKLTATEAQNRHGSGGDGCWDTSVCHKRRTYYRNRDRYNKTRRLQRHTAKNTPLEVPIPAVPAAVLYLYRERVDAPLHAIGAALWLGQEKVSMIEPKHCMGLTSRHVSAFLQEILQTFSRKANVPIAKFATQVELHPSTCPIKPCPLHPD